MNWGRGNFSRSVAFRWIVSYAVILFIPVIFSVIIYSQTREIVGYEIKRASGAMLQQVRYIVDGELHQTESLAAQLSIHPDVKKLLSSPKEENAYRIYKTKQELSKMLSANDFIKEIYLYSNSLQSVLSSETYVQDRMFYEMKFQTDTFAYGDWLDLMKEHQPGRYVLLPAQNQGKTVNTPFYIRSLPMQAGTDPLGALLISLNAEKIKVMLENIDWAERGQVFIMDANDQILFQNAGDSTLTPSSYREWNDRGTGTFTAKFQGVESMVTIETSDISGWKYVSVFPTDVLWERARAIRTMNVFGLALSFAIGGAVIYYFARKNYVPVKQLMSVFSRNPLQGSGAKLDEYAFIQRSVLETIRERDDMNIKNAQQLRVLQNYYLGRLLKGQADRNIPLKELAKANSFTWTSDRFAALLFYIDNGEGGTGDLAFLRFIVTNIVTDSVGDRLTIYFTDVDNMLAAVVNVDHDRAEQWKDDLEDALAKANEFIAARYRLRFTTAGSELQTGLDGVHQAFLQALETGEYRMVLGEGTMIWHGDVKPRERSYFFTVNDQMILMNLLNAGEFAKAKLMIDNVVLQAFQRQASLEIAKGVLLDIATTLMKTIPDREQAGIAWDEWRPLKRLLSCSTRTEFQQELLDLFNRVCGVLRSKQSDRTLAGIGDKIIEFVQGNYSDKNLSVSMIGDHFRLTPQYASRLFSEQIGKGLHDYINRTRVEASKEMLHKGTSIDETAFRIGFASGHAFIRVFKKYEGITPGKYKTIACRITDLQEGGGSQ